MNTAGELDSVFVVEDVSDVVGVAVEVGVGVGVDEVVSVGVELVLVAVSLGVGDGVVDVVSGVDVEVSVLLLLLVAVAAGLSAGVELAPIISDMVTVWKSKSLATLICAIGLSTVNLSGGKSPINQHGQAIERSQRDSMGHSAGTREKQLAIRPSRPTENRVRKKDARAKERMTAISDRPRKERERRA